ncbi:MAG TPA: hypothetical protein VJZ71_03100 [Phycisphaerae bacterium]|nr:hypothetical protein [Phycisphaerae bacterium]
MMSRFFAVALGALCSASIALAQSAAQPAGTPPQSPATQPFLLGPPQDGGPVVVKANFHLHGLNAIDDEAETFDFTGVLTLQWKDPRQAFDPRAAGVNEKIYQGTYQFDEISPSWYPQDVLVNEAGMYDKSGVVLRSQPDGTQTLVQMVNAVAKTELKMRRFPFDHHQLEAVFEVFGFDKGEVELQAEPRAGGYPADALRVPQWTVTGIAISARDRPATYAGRRGVSSALVLSVEVRRQSFYFVRLIFVPLAMIVLLSFSVFWMDRSSLGDRISVSFIGILTSVAYLIVTNDILPRISYVTLIHGFLNISFLTVSATVVINLVVGALDRKGKQDTGHLIDRRCRWIFPLVYFAMVSVIIAIAIILF